LNQTQPDPREFRSLRRFGGQVGASRRIGMGFVRARDLIARGLNRMGVTPNLLTFAGFAVTCGAGVCLAFGAGHHAPWSDVGPGIPASRWPLAAALFIFVAGALDMLDGALARVGGQSTRFGAVFDSITDRGSDAALCLGCAVHFAHRGNVTYVALSMLVLTNAFLVSYIKARAENVIEKCDAGYWQRGERIAAFLIAATAGHLTAALWLLAVSGFFTVLRRARHAAALLSDHGRPWEPTGRLRAIMIWRHPRGSLGYDLVTGTNIAFLIVAPTLWPWIGPAADPLERLLTTLAS